MLVNSATSLLPVYTRGGANTIIYLSTTTNIGQLVTVRDMDGFLSTPQTITVSTTGGATLSGATLSGATPPLTLQQGFGYVTLRSTGPAAWTVVDTSPFPDPAADYDVRGVSYSSMAVTGFVNLTSGLLTTGPVTASTATALQTMSAQDRLYVSTLQVATALGANVARIAGPTEITGGLAVASTFSVAAGTTIATSLSTGGTFSTGGTVAFIGSLNTTTITCSSNVSVATATTITGTLVAGQGLFGDSIRVTRDLSVTSSLTTTAVVATAVAADEFRLSTAIAIARSDISVVDPLYTGVTTPVVFTTAPLSATRTLVSSLAATTATASTLVISSVIASPSLSQANFGSAAVTAGSATLSSVATATITIGTLTSSAGRLPVLGTGAVTASTLTVEYRCITGPIGAATLRADGLSTTAITASSINTGQIGIQGDTMSMSSIFVSSGGIMPALSSFVAPNAVATALSATISSATISSVVAATLAPQVLRSATASTFALSTSVFSTAQTSSATAITVTTSSIGVTLLTLGTPLSYSTIGPADPYTTVSTASGISTNTRYEYIQGLGTPYEPLQIHASLDRTVNITLANVSTQTSTCYFTANMTYRNDSSISGVAGLRIVNSGGTSTIISFNANPIVPFQKVTLSNYPIEQSVAASTNRYYLGGVATLQAPSTITAPKQVWLAGGTGVSTLGYSTDGGSNWSAISSGAIFNASTTALAWSGTYWVAGGAQATAGNSLAYSYNGTTWFGASNTVFSTRVNGVAYNDTLWVAAGEGTNTLGYSYDGNSWTGLGTTTFSTRASAVAWNGFVWVAVGQGTSSAAYSYNGTTWTGQALFSGYGLCAAWGQDKWLAGGSGPSSYNLYSSPDGISWTGIGPIIGGAAVIADIAWNGSQWLAVSATQVAYSANGLTWTTVTPAGTYTRLNSVTWTGLEWLLGATGTDKLLKSTDGASWSVALTGSAVITNTVNAVRARRTLPLDVSGSDFIVALSEGAANTYYSLGGTAWYTGVSGLFTMVHGVAYGNGRWVAVGVGSPDMIAYSNDGINWTGTAAIFSSGHAVAYNGYMWVAVGEAAPGNAIAYSYDGINWTGVTGDTIFVFAFGVAWDHTQWYAYGPGNPSTTVATSPDGITWTAQSTAAGPTSSPAVDTANSVWVGGDIGYFTDHLYRSTDGITWTPVAVQPFDTACYAAAYNGSTWVAVGGSGATSTSIAYSIDGGLTWTAASSVFETGTGITWTGKVWVATGVPSVSGPTVAVSADAITWTPYATDLFSGTPVVASRSPLPYGFRPENVTYALGDSTSNTMAVSTDGKTFIGLGLIFQATTYGGYCIAWNGSLWVAGGAGTNPVKYSTDGFNWTTATLSAPANVSVLLSVTYGKGRWVGGIQGPGGQYQFIDSTDGINWTVRTGFVFSLQTNAVAFAAGLFVAGGQGDGGTGSGLRYSLDGITWSTGSFAGQGLGTGAAVAYGNGLWVAGGGNYELAYSTTGTSWTVALGSPLSLFGGGCLGVAYGNGRWVAVGVGPTNTIAYSTNGTSWTGIGTTIFSGRSTSVCWNGSRFVATGWGPNTIAYSADGVAWTGLGLGPFTGGAYQRGYGCGTRQILPVRDAPTDPAPITTEAKTFNWSLTNMMAVTQTNVQKSAGGSAWNARAASAESFISNAYLSFSAGQTTGELMMGFSENPSSTTSFTALNFAIYLRSNGTVNLVELGSTVVIAGSYTTADIFRLIYDGSTIRYFQGSTLLRSVSRATGAALYLSSSFYTPNAQVTAVDFHALYTLTPTQPALSAQGYSVTSNSGTSVEQFAPFYQTLTTDLVNGTWNIYVNLDGQPTSPTTSFWADVCINEVKYFSTTVIAPQYTTSPSTYVLSFTTTSPVSISTPALLSLKWRATRPAGNTFLYTSWSNAIEQRSSVALQATTNPNAIEYLQFFHTSFGSGLQTTELDFWVSQTSTLTANYVAPSTGLEMNRGYITWASPLNSVTIENRFNDTTTRSLTYTGAIYNASDPRAKTAIQSADTAAIAETVSALPLYRYNWTPAYQALYRPTDIHQLGVLATDLQTAIPGAVSVGPAPLEGLESFLTVDRAQLRFAHLAATKSLVARVSTLKSRIALALSGTPKIPSLHGRKDV